MNLSKRSQTRKMPGDQMSHHECKNADEALSMLTAIQDWLVLPHDNNPQKRFALDDEVARLKRKIKELGLE